MKQSSQDLTYSCPDCGSTIHPVTVPIPKNLQDLMGKERVEKGSCPCQKAKADKAQALNRQHTRGSELDKRFRDAQLGTFSRCTFDSWEWVATKEDPAGTWTPEQVKKALLPSIEACAQLVKTWPQGAPERLPGTGLLLFGGNGLGKTHMAAALANEALVRGYVVLFMTMPDLIAKFRGCISGKENEEDLMWLLVNGVDLLVLDDLGQEQLTQPWGFEKLYRIVNGRYVLDKPIIATTNRTFKEEGDPLTDLGPAVGKAVFSRFREMTIPVRFAAPAGFDFRRILAIRRAQARKQWPSESG